VLALINIDFDTVGRWAEKRGLAYTTFVDLSQKSEVYDLICGVVEGVNRVLPPAARIRRFVLLHKEFDADEGELTCAQTPEFASDRYSDMIAAIYDGSDAVVRRPNIAMGPQIVETTARVATLEREGSLL
jgi:long-chain acyl-CoA synthetase